MDTMQKALPSCFDNATRAKILRLDGFSVIYSYSNMTACFK